MRALHQRDLHAEPRVIRAMDQREQRTARTWQQRDLDLAQRHAVFRLEPGNYHTLRIARAHRNPLGALLRRPDARPSIDIGDRTSTRLNSRHYCASRLTYYTTQQQTS